MERDFQLTRSEDREIALAGKTKEGSSRFGRFGCTGRRVTDEFCDEFRWSGGERGEGRG